MVQRPARCSPHGATPRSTKPPFDRERFVFKTLTLVIGTRLLIASLLAGVCAERALGGKPVGQIGPGTLEKLQSDLDSTLNLLLRAGRSSTLQAWRHTRAVNPWVQGRGRSTSHTTSSRLVVLTAVKIQSA